MAIYTKEEWLKNGMPAQSSYSPDGETFYTGDDIHAAWLKHHPAAAGLRPMPSIVDLSGKFIVVSQFCEPKTRKWNPIKDDWEWTTHSLQELGPDWWRVARPGVYDVKRIEWGHSTWQVQIDGTLAFVGADYDSSG